MERTGDLPADHGLVYSESVRAVFFFSLPLSHYLDLDFVPAGEEGETRRRRAQEPEGGVAEWGRSDFEAGLVRN